MTYEVTTLEAKYYDIAGAVEKTAYFSRRDKSITTGASDTPAHTPFIPRMVNAGTFDLFMFGNAKVGGVGSQAGGAIVLDNADGGLDYLRAAGMDGRRLTIRRGRDTGAYPSTFTTLLAGTMLQPIFTFNDVTLRIRSRLAEVMNKTVQQEQYAGNNALPNGVEGVATDIKGQYKPRIWGKCLHVPPVLVNTSNNTYQISANAITSLDAFYVQGAQTWTSHGTYSTLALLQAASIPSAKYGVYLGAGGDGAYIRTGSNAHGLITLDVTAPKQTAGDIVADVLENYAGIPAGDITGTSTLNTDAPAVLGFWTGTGALKVADVVNAALGSVGGFLTETRAGKFVMGQFKAPSGASVLTITRTYIDEQTAQPQLLTNGEVGYELPVYRVSVGYQRVYQTQNASELAGAAAQTVVAQVVKELRYAVSTDSAILTKHPLAGDLSKEAYFSTEADAATEAARLLALYGAERELVSVPVTSAITGALNLNDVVTLQLPRYTWGSGKQFRVVGISENYNTNVTILQLYG